MKTTMTLKPVLSVLIAAFCLSPNLSTAAPAAQGGLDAGGGNAVGGTIFDDVENDGSDVVNPAKIAALVNPLLKNLDEKLPDMAAQLRAGIKGVTWYMESKGLNQNGPCRNNTVVSVERTVVACQTKLAVRIDKTWFEANANSQGPLLVHELLVYRQLRLKDVSDEAVREVSRQIRNPAIGAEDLKQAVKRAGFGTFLTVPEKSYAARLRKMTKAFCKDNNQRALTEIYEIGSAFLKQAGFSQAQAESTVSEWNNCD